jgi:hypothetical protein
MGPPNFRFCRRAGGGHDDRENRRERRHCATTGVPLPPNSRVDRLALAGSYSSRPRFRAGDHSPYERIVVPKSFSNTSTTVAR